jgi:hypothetical protein
MDSPDYILVRDGVEPQSPILHRFCNSRSSVDVESSGENLLVELIADGLKQSQGFAATFVFVPSLAPPPSSSSTTNNDGPPQHPLQLPPGHGDWNAPFGKVGMPPTSGPALHTNYPASAFDGECIEGEGRRRSERLNNN